MRNLCWLEICKSKCYIRHSTVILDTAVKTNPFQASIPIMEKPGGWFLVAKYVENTYAAHQPASLLKMSLFHRYFSHIFLVRTIFLVSP